MATACHTDGEYPDEIQSIQDLFPGRFTKEDVEALYDFHNYDKTQTVKYIREADESDVTKRIEAEKNKWETTRKKQRNIPRNVTDKEKLQSWKNPTKKRMFACVHCDETWWKWKMDSICDTCNTRYEALPENIEWGLAEFRCPACLAFFRWFCHMAVFSRCYRCKNPVYPKRIIPERIKTSGQKQPKSQKSGQNQSESQKSGQNQSESKKSGQNQTKSQKPWRPYQHNCNACCGHMHGGVVWCADPDTRLRYKLPKVMNGSKRHI